MIEERKLQTVWMKAAIVGGLWAAVEIILGSFLHNLRIPFSGTFLTIQGVILLIAFLGSKARNFLRIPLTVSS